MNQTDINLFFFIFFHLDMGKNRKGTAKNAKLGRNLIRQQKGANSRRRETKESWVCR